MGKKIRDLLFRLQLSQLEKIIDVSGIRREFVKRDLREVAISLALQLSLSECCEIISNVEVTLPSGRSAKPRCYDAEEPDHLLRARDLYAERFMDFGKVAKARALLRRLGVPECYHTLAFLIARGIIHI